MSDVKVIGRRATAVSERLFERAEDCIYPMPTREEIEARGYTDVDATWQRVKRERDDFIARFNSDPEFRELARREAREAQQRRS